MRASAASHMTAVSGGRHIGHSQRALPGLLRLPPVSSVAAADAAGLPSACAAHAGACCIGRFEELSANVYLPLPSEASLLFTFDLAVTVAHQEQVLAKESGLQALLTAFKDGYA